VSRYLNPEHVDSLPANASPLRRALTLRADRLRDGAVDELVVAWGYALNHLPAHEIAAEVARRLGRREANPSLRTPHPPSPREMRLAGVLARHFGGEVEIVPFARDFAKDFGGEVSEKQIVRAV